ncbi:M20/M25/M40 family metallo-hydrolase [Pseudoalteromonas caenipelagi]|nr:M20/M25/M40 family metallo-hydrolase [Pseudoalteromonas caenipelagi]
MSAQFIFERFKTLGLATKYQTFSFRDGIFSTAYGHNVVAQLPCNTLHCGRTIVISAHYDHLGASGSRLYAGANDNASGTVALLSLAQQLRNITRRNHVTFLATDAEEKGLYGAKHYVEHIDDAHQYVLNINLDMLAPGQNNTLYVMQSANAKHYSQTITTLQTHPLNIKLVSPNRMKRLIGDGRTDWLRASDHYAFYRAGIPYLYFGMGEDKNHHSTNDTLDSIDFDKYQQVVKFINDFMVALLSCPSDCTS